MEIQEELLSNTGKLQDLVGQHLEATRVEFVEQMQLIQEKKVRGEKWSASGVLVPLELDPIQREFVFVLNKRSIHVQQPGDLCCPGGGADRRLDSFFSKLLAHGILPAKRSKPFRRLLASHGKEKEVLLFVYAGVLRESWEEMRLKPWNVEYLGALPTHHLPNFSRVIFPVVGRIRHKWKPRPNWEVEKVLRLPLRAFFEPDNYAFCKMSLPTHARERFGADSWEVPCMIVQDEGQEEILWGATFRILLTFMDRVFDFPVGRIHPTRKVHKEMPENYYTGKRGPKR